MRPPTIAPRRATAVVAVLGAAVTSVAFAVTAHPVAASATPESGNVAAFAAKTSSIPVHGRGNGHGHGMSQYGAQGAAIAGLTSRQIVAFYYPNTTLTTLAPSTIRVSLSGAGSSTNVATTTPGLSVTGYGPLPATGYQRFRLVASGSGLALGGQRTTGAWVRVRSGLPARADFSSSVGYVRVFLTDGTSTRYRGTVGAVRSGAGLLTINRVSLDDYTMGVVPREMPASWRAAAVGAQAIAARSYGRNAVESHTSGLYDICDTTWCQVYGGMTHYSSSGSVLWNDDPAAVVGNQNMVLRYGSQTIFAQFSASNGGAMLSGGLPYLVGKTDPYDNTTSGDPYLGWADSVSETSVASYYGLQSVSSIEVTRRNGYGLWGGWVLSATVNGTTWSGSATHVSTTGGSLASAMGVLTAYFHFDSEPTTPSSPTSVHVSAGDAGATVSWAAPSDAALTGISGYQLRWGAYTRTFPATTHSAYVAPIYEWLPERIWLTAYNVHGSSPATIATADGAPAPDPIVAISPHRILDSRPGAPVSATHPYLVNVAGKGTIPTSGATSVQLSLTVLHESAAGRLAVYVQGSPAAPMLSIPYQAGRILTTTISVRLRPSSTLLFKPSAGSVDVVGEQESYTASWGRYVKPVLPTLVSSTNAVSTNGSTTISLAGRPGVTPATQAVLLSIRGWGSPTSSWLRIWPTDRSQPKVVHVTVAPWGPNVNTVLVRLPPSRTLHLAAGRTGIGARVTLLGLVGNGGGRLETVPTSDPIADDSVPGHPSRVVGTAITPQRLLGLGRTPASGARAVLVQFRVTATGWSGRLYAWPTGHARPVAAVVVAAAGQTQTATALLMVGTGGSMNLQATTPGFKVSISSMGYLSTS